MTYQPVAAQFCTWEVFEHAPPRQYVALNIAYVRTSESATCRVSLGTIPQRITDPEASTNYRMFSKLLTPAGLNGETEAQIYTLEWDALEKGCQEFRKLSSEAGSPITLSSDNFFLLFNGRVVYAPEHPFKCT